MIKTVIVFSKQTIQLFQLAKTKQIKKSKILNSIKIDLPVGLISRHGISDVETLSKYLVSLLKQTKYHPQSVSLVIPEDTVISKSLVLPVLKSKEVKEAIKWQVEKFLPYSLDKSVWDWKTVKGQDQQHILFQTLPKDIVDNYLQMFKDLKIRVDVLETTALALSRVAQPQKTKFLIYIDQSEAIITLVSKYEVVATSIIKQDPQLAKHLLFTLQRMQRYYNKFTAELLQVGGIGLTTDLLENLKTLKLPILGFNLPFIVQPAIANQFLLAISASLKPALPPSDPQTINLLPEKYVKNNQLKKMLSLMQQLFLGAVLYSSILFAASTIALFYLNNINRQFLNKKNDNSILAKDVVVKARQINSLSKSIVNLQKYDFFPLKLTQKLRNTNTKGIELMSISFDMIKNQAEIRGMAKDRVSLLSYKKSLESLKMIKAVVLPVSSFTQEEDLPFQLSLKLDKNLSNFEKNNESKKN